MNAWGKGVVEQVSLDLQAAYSGTKGFSTTNLWYMKKWYQFYTDEERHSKLQQAVGELEIPTKEQIRQIAMYQQEEKLQQFDAELPFPSAFAFVPWGHHVLIITKCKSVEEALFYIQRRLRKTGAAAPWMTAFEQICIMYPAVH